MQGGCGVGEIGGGGLVARIIQVGNGSTGLFVFVADPPQEEPEPLMGDPVTNDVFTHQAIRRIHCRI